MAYCIAKSIEIQRGKALKEIFLEGRSVAQVARRFGRNRSILYRWIKRWREINNYPDFRNYGRPNRAPGKKLELERSNFVVWLIFQKETYLLQLC